MKPFLIGIAGRSGAGKSEIARQLAAWLPGKTEVLSLDSYYHAMDHVPLEERERVNFDHPDALDWPLIVEHVSALARGEMIAEPIYVFAEHTRAAEKRPVMPSRYVILEGLFTLHNVEVRAMLNAKIYIETPDEVCYDRRKTRDIVERGRTIESIQRQYCSTVRPMAEAYVAPSSAHADLVLRGDIPLGETVAIVKAFLQPPVMARPAVVLPVESVADSVRFYTDLLGFEALGAGRVRRDAVELQFLAKAGGGASLEVRVTEIEKLYREYAGGAAGSDGSGGPTKLRIETPGGRKSFSIVDNAGMLVTFFES